MAASNNKWWISGKGELNMLASKKSAISNLGKILDIKSKEKGGLIMVKISLIF
jgi:hypothetical protein